MGAPAGQLEGCLNVSAMPDSPASSVKWRRACPCRCHSHCWRWPYLQPVPASSSSSWASFQGSWQPESAASLRAPTAQASRRWLGPGWRWTVSSRCHRRRDSSRPAWLLAPAPGGPEWFLPGDPRKLLPGLGTLLRKCPLGWQPLPLPLPHPGWRTRGATQGNRGLERLRTSPSHPRGSALAGVRLCVGGHTWVHSVFRSVCIWRSVCVSVYLGLC
uniref:cDNA FLJ38464 fis, clone FEBRA2021171 n=1 Tax=Homo sapiens TaxID=9606 RepID=Q8N930_HUMAN|nr:unnamed protein product [Homo sapiens]